LETFFDYINSYDGSVIYTDIYDEEIIKNLNGFNCHKMTIINNTIAPGSKKQCKQIEAIYFKNTSNLLALGRFFV
jgi:hypothetical protein